MLCESLCIGKLNTFLNKTVNNIAIFVRWKRNSVAIEVSLGERPQAFDKVVFTPVRRAE